MTDLFLLTFSLIFSQTPDHMKSSQIFQKYYLSLIYRPEKSVFLKYYRTFLTFESFSIDN